MPWTILGGLHDGYMLPVLDMSVVQTLAGDLGSSREALNFLDSFDALLSSRLQKIHNALITQDLENMKVALLSLHTSAAMAGALQLHACTGRILQQIDTWPLPAPVIRALMKNLAKEAIQFTRAHRMLYSQQVQPAPNLPVVSHIDKEPRQTGPFEQKRLERS